VEKYEHHHQGKRNLLSDLGDCESSFKRSRVASIAYIIGETFARLLYCVTKNKDLPALFAPSLEPSLQKYQQTRLENFSEVELKEKHEGGGGSSSDSRFSVSYHSEDRRVKRVSS